jgi:hypothetical protein
MNREEQRARAAHEYIQSDSVAAGNEVLAFGDFINGAKWADFHPQWIPVEERLPKENQSVFICNARHDYGTALYQGGEWFITREYVAINVTVSHCDVVRI